MKYFPMVDIDRKNNIRFIVSGIQQLGAATLNFKDSAQNIFPLPIILFDERHDTKLLFQFTSTSSD